MKAQNGEQYKTILVIVIGMTVIYIITKQNWPLYTALIIGSVGAFSKYLADKINYIWLKIGTILSYIVPNILLSIIFFVFLGISNRSK